MNVEILYDHYKDSFSQIKKNEKTRENYFIACGLIFLVFIAVTIEPQNTIKTISNIIEVKVGSKCYINFSYVQSFLWICLLYALMNYYKMCIHIERAYNYLHEIEGNIQNEIHTTFSREGKSYLNNYPILLEFIFKLYTLFYPLLFISIIIYKLKNEVMHETSNYIFDTVIGGICIFTIIAYLFKQ